MKKFLKWIILAIALNIIIYTINGIYQEAKIKKGHNAQTKIEIYNSNNEVAEAKNKPKQKLNLVQEEYEGYKVAANLKIERLNIDTCVLQDYTNSAMDICVTKFFGPNANEVGNFCITGHNYITKNMFGYLYKIEIGDILTLTDNFYGEIEYAVYDKYRAEATDTYRIITKN